MPEKALESSTDQMQQYQIQVSSLPMLPPSSVAFLHNTAKNVISRTN